MHCNGQEVQRRYSVDLYPCWLQVMYHQHLQHRQGHEYFVPKAMCQQLLEAARRVSRPPQQPAQQHQPHTNAYLDVLEQGLSTQKKPAKRPDDGAPPEPPPLEEILGREPGEINPGKMHASSDGVTAAGAIGDGALLVASQQQDKPSAAAANGSAGAVHGQQQSGSIPSAPPDNLSLQSDGAKQSADSAAATQSDQPEKGASSGSRLLEKFHAARQQHSASSGATLGARLAAGGVPALGATPTNPSPLGRQQLPLLSPLVLASAPNHTPLQIHTSSKPTAPHQAFSFGLAGQLQSILGKSGDQSAINSEQTTPVQLGRLQCVTQPADSSSFSFGLDSPGPPQATPPSFAKLLQEYGSTGGKAQAAEQLKPPALGTLYRNWHQVNEEQR